MRQNQLRDALLAEALAEADALMDGLSVDAKEKYAFEARCLRKRMERQIAFSEKHRRVKLFRWQTVAIAAALTVLLCGAGIALSDIPARFFADDAMVDGVVNRKEIFEATCVADFRLNEAGELEMYQFVLKNPRGVQDDAYGNGNQQPAVTWTGKIAYIRHWTSALNADGEPEAKCSYVPVSFAQSVCAHDDSVVLREIRIEGGAYGQAYDINNQFRRTTVSMAADVWSVDEPNSGAWYQQAFDNPGYAFMTGDAETQVSTVGTIFYSLSDDPAAEIRQTQTCRLELLDWWN